MPAEWVKIAQKELGKEATAAGTTPDSLIWHTAEGIAVKPIYTVCGA